VRETNNERIIQILKIFPLLLIHISAHFIWSLLAQTKNVGGKKTLIDLEEG
jgi:hypothetical protein